MLQSDLTPDFLLTAGPKKLVCFAVLHLLTRAHFPPQNHVFHKILLRRKEKERRPLFSFHGRPSMQGFFEQ